MTVEWSGWSKLKLTIEEFMRKRKHGSFYCNERRNAAEPISQCNQTLNSDERLLKSNVPIPQTISDSVSRCKRYMELEKLCYLAVTIEHQALLDVPKEKMIDFSQEDAPFRPENLYTWQEAANLAIPNGCYLFGKCLLNGGEIKEGLSWLKTAASKGNEHAKRTLGEYFMDNGEPDEGLRLLQEASDAGDAYACESLAHRYDEGDGVPKSKSKFRSYLKRAALLGSHIAMLFLEADESRPSWRW
jgi:TPR repeat protein